MPPLLRLAALSALFLLSIISTKEVISRRTCRRHYLAGISATRLLPLQLNDGAVASIVCEMPKSGETVVTTVIHSALEKGYVAKERRTVGFQIRDLPLLQEIVRTHQCTQTVTVKWSQAPQGDKGDISVQSALQTVTILPYTPEPLQIVLEGAAAGILHVLPNNEQSEIAPHIEASPLRCQQSIGLHDDCLMDGEVEINFAPDDTFFEFSFRTDQTDQSLFDIYLSEDLVSHVRLERDFFLRIDSTGRHNVGLLNDGRWHTVRFQLRDMTIEIDNLHKIPSKMLLDETKVRRITIKLNGQILLTHPKDEKDKCVESLRRRFISPRSLSSREFCWDSQPCDCRMLSNIFESLPSPACKPTFAEEEGAFHLLRTADLLSFLYLPDVLQDGVIRTAVAFRSDADSGLVMFGSWKEGHWGRFQVHYHGERMSAILCTQKDENNEQCTACAIYKRGGFSDDKWINVAFFADQDSHFMSVDRDVCELAPLTEENEFDTAEMYKTLLTKGSVLFIGGMFHKKVKPGIYKEDFKQKYFENTREKLPSLRGCVKDVYSGGHKISLLAAFEHQMTGTLVNPQRKSYGVMRGCGICPVKCVTDARCRPSTNQREPEFACDCGDILQYTQSNGQCKKPEAGILSLASSSLNAYRGVLSIPRSKGNLQRLWIKFRMPKIELKQSTPLILLYSHGKIVFRIYLDVYGAIYVQVNPEDPAVYISSTGKSIERGDDRIHLLKLEKRTPLGTHPSRRFFNLFIDGERFDLPDPGMALTSAEFSLLDVPEERDAGCVTDFGIAYEYDEHSGGTIEQIDLKGLMIRELGLSMKNETCGTEDPFLWTYGPQEVQASPYGNLFEYTPSGMPQTAELLSPELIIYSIILTCLLVLIILLFLCFYCCVLRNKRTKIDDDKQRMMRRRSDEYPVMLRRPTCDFTDRESCISDSLDHSDIRAYDDIVTHKVKIDRESMISFLDPISDENTVGVAAIVRRNDENAPLVKLQDEDN